MRPCGEKQSDNQQQCGRRPDPGPPRAAPGPGADRPDFRAVGRLCRDRLEERFRQRTLRGPARQVDRLVLAKPQGRLAVVDQNWNQPIGVPALGGFVLDPCGFDRRARPQNDDRIRFLQRLIDLLAEAGPAADVPVPLDFMPGHFQRLRDRLGAGGILS